MQFKNSLLRTGLVNSMENKKFNNLTSKQERFCREYLIDLNATQAAIRAGYSRRRAKEIGYQLLHKTTLQDRISVLRKEQEKRTEITADWVLLNLKENVERCMQEKPVMVKQGGKWIESGEYRYDSTGAIRSLELIGKHLGLFKDVQVTKTETIDDDLEKMTVEELEGLRDIIREHLVRIRLKDGKRPETETGEE